MRKFNRIGLALASLALLGLASLAMAEDRPFQLSGRGALGFNPQQTLSGSFSASGQATHLGAWTNAGTITFVPLDETTLSADGTARFFAANGDLLDMHLSGVLDLTSGHALGTFVITGGTGRFVNAAGMLQMELQQAPDGSFSFTLTGTVNY